MRREEQLREDNKRFRKAGLPCYLRETPAHLSGSADVLIAFGRGLSAEGLGTGGDQRKAVGKEMSQP